MSNGNAARTASDLLARIERWGRLTFYASALSAALLAILAGIALYLGSDYLRAKQAMGEASRKLSEDIRARPIGRGVR